MKGSVSQDLSVSYLFSRIEPTWALEKQAEHVLCLVLISSRYSITKFETKASFFLKTLYKRSASSDYPQPETGKFYYSHSPVCILTLQCPAHRGVSSLSFFWDPCTHDCRKNGGNKISIHTSFKENCFV